MIITKLALPRRTFLRGLGATLALPVARRDGAGVRRPGAAAAPVRRLGVVYIPTGSNIAPVDAEAGGGYACRRSRR